jgi:hypothetical protein
MCLLPGAEQADSLRRVRGDCGSASSAMRRRPCGHIRFGGPERHGRKVGLGAEPANCFSPWSEPARHLHAGIGRRRHRPRAGSPRYSVEARCDGYAAVASIPVLSGSRRVGHRKARARRGTVAGSSDHGERRALPRRSGIGDPDRGRGSPYLGAQGVRRQVAVVAGTAPRARRPAPAVGCGPSGARDGDGAVDVTYDEEGGTPSPAGADPAPSLQSGQESRVAGRPPSGSA